MQLGSGRLLLRLINGELPTDLAVLVTQDGVSSIIADLLELRSTPHFGD